MISIDTLNNSVLKCYFLDEELTSVDEDNRIAYVSASDVELLDKFYENKCLTWEGLDKRDFERALSLCGQQNAKGYVIPGNVMNSHYNLLGKNAYPYDLNVFVIDKPRGLSTTYNARWFKDVVDKNREAQDGESER